MSRRFRLLPENKALAWTPYAWLIYLPTFLMDPWMEMRAGALSAGEIAATTFTVVTFLISYFYGFWVRGNRLIIVAVFQTMLAVVFAPTHVGSFVFFIYGASFPAQYDPGRRALEY